MTSKELMRVDPEFRKIVRKVKKELDFSSDKRATKEIARILKKKKKQMIL